MAWVHSALPTEEDLKGLQGLRLRIQFSPLPFQIWIERSFKKRAIYVDENLSGRPNGEDTTRDIWSLSHAYEYVDGMDCGRNATAGSIGPEVLNNRDEWTVSS